MKGGRPQPSSCSSHFEGGSLQRSPTFSADDGWELPADVRELSHDMRELPPSRCELAADRGELADVVKVPFARRSVTVGVAKSLADGVCGLAAVGRVLVTRGVGALTLNMGAPTRRLHAPTVEVRASRGRLRGASRRVGALTRRLRRISRRLRALRRRGRRRSHGVGACSRGLRSPGDRPRVRSGRP